MSFRKHSNKETLRNSNAIPDWAWWTRQGFHKEVERLKKIGAKYVSLKTGAYRPADLARAVKYASDAKIDLLTVDGAGGGTGMSPWRMMNEWGVPTVYLESLLYQYLKRLEQKGAFIPSCAMAGGFALEDNIFKGIALAAPYIKAVCLGRASMTAAMVGNTIGEMIKKGEGAFANVSQIRNRCGAHLRSGG